MAKYKYRVVFSNTGSTLRAVCWETQSNNTEKVYCIIELDLELSNYRLLTRLTDMLPKNFSYDTTDVPMGNAQTWCGRLSKVIKHVCNEEYSQW